LHEDREDAPTTRATPVAPVGSLSSRGWRWSRRRSIGVLTGLAATLALVTWRAVPIAFTGAPGVAATRVTLADGSQVWLAEGATLTVPRALGWPSVWRTLRRDVTLTGTAFFTVARDGRDFAVRTPDAVVRVLGTRFEVRAQTAGSRVLVEEGHVSVTASRTQSRVELRAGEATRIVASPLAVTPVAVARVGTWREGGLAALDEPLREVLAELERRFHREITIDGDVMADAPVSLFYPRAPELETILTDLCTAHGLRFRQTSRGFVIMRGPGLE
jgi:ferric-dicitrate binding protein FerR (iron transport regulator)